MTRWLARASVDATRPRGDLADGADVGLDVAIELRLGQLREGLDLEALVGVLDVDGEQAADVGVVDLDPLELGLAVLAEQMDLVAEPGQRAGQVGVVDVAAGAAQHVAVKDEDAHRSPPKLLVFAAMNERQLYRMRAPASGREALAHAEPGSIYVDRETGEEMEPVAMVLPLAPSASALPRTPENLRACRRCDQLIGLDVSDCPYCGLRQQAI